MIDRRSPALDVRPARFRAACTPYGCCFLAYTRITCNNTSRERGVRLRPSLGRANVRHVVHQCALGRVASAGSRLTRPSSQASAAFDRPLHGDRQWQAIRSYPTSAEMDSSGSWSRMATTYFVAHPGPLSGSRPASTDRSLSEHIGEQRIDARLWQDPFAVVADDLSKIRSSNRKSANARTVTDEDIETYCQPPLGQHQAASRTSSLWSQFPEHPTPTTKRGAGAGVTRCSRDWTPRDSCRRTRNTSVSTGPTSPSLRSKGSTAGR